MIVVLELSNYWIQAYQTVLKRRIKRNAVARVGKVSSRDGYLQIGEGERKAPFDKRRHAKGGLSRRGASNKRWVQTPSKPVRKLDHMQVSGLYREFAVSTRTHCPAWANFVVYFLFPIEWSSLCETVVHGTPVEWRIKKPLKPSRISSTASPSFHHPNIAHIL